MSGSGEKKHPPSLRKLTKARREGNVARSALFTASFSTIVLATGVSWTIDGLAERFRERTSVLINLATNTDAASAAFGAAADLALSSLLDLAPLLVVASATALLVAFLQVGPVLSIKALVPKLDRLNPATGLQQRVLSASAMAEALKNLVVVLVLGTVLAALLIRSIEPLTRATFADTAHGWQLIVDMAGHFLRFGGMAFVAIGAADLMYQRHRYFKEQRMTDQELREEHREDQGDPEVVRNRKARHREILQQGQLAATSRAHALMRNPTHLACAIVYDAENGCPPTIVAKGADAMALRMVEVATERRIDMFEDVPLTRALYRLPVGRPIPKELFVAVQAVLAQVQERMILRGEMPPWLPFTLEPGELAYVEDLVERVRRQIAGVDGNAAPAAPTTL